MNTEIKSAEGILIKHQPIFDEFIQTVAVKKHIIAAMEEYASQFKQPGISEDVESAIIVRRLEGVMSQFGEAHNMLAKTSLSKAEYQPISSLLSTAKVGLFNVYNELKNEVTWAKKAKSQQPIPTVDEDAYLEVLKISMGYDKSHPVIGPTISKRAKKLKEHFSITRK